jgi:hypothetical protein
MMIVRAWVMQAMNPPTGSSLKTALESLKGRRIAASQPACWYCHAFMTTWGIIMEDSKIGNKPMTAWRHPISGVSVANHGMPERYQEVLTAMAAEKAAIDRS